MARGGPSAPVGGALRCLDKALYCVFLITLRSAADAGRPAPREAPTSTGAPHKAARPMQPQAQAVYALRPAAAPTNGPVRGGTWRESAM